MNDVDSMDAAELRFATHKRDGEPVSQFEVRFTDPSAWCEELKLDWSADAVTDELVRLAVVNGPASYAELAGQWVPGASRINPMYQSKYIEATYQARGQLVKLSSYCGVASSDMADERTRTLGVLRTEECAKALHAARQKVLSTVAACKGLSVRGGGFYVQDGPWTAFPGAPIDALAELTCATCGDPIYWSNQSWRHTITKQAEVTLPDGVRPDGRPKTKLHHLADPEVEGRSV